MTERASRTEPAGTVSALVDAARRSLHAPSVFNTQPWRWRVAGETLELYADPGRQLVATDPGGRLLTLSCGAALHHALVALVAAGWRTDVQRQPEPEQPDLLARIRLLGPAEPDPAAAPLAAAIPRRRTDRRAFGDRPVPMTTLTDLRAVVESKGAYLHVVRLDQMPMLAVSTAQAAAAELADPAYRAELAHWTNRPADSGDGVPAETAVQPGPRRVPVRDYAPGGSAGLAPGTGADRGAAYVVLFGERDEPDCWLRAGEALSALLLTATAAGLATAPISDAVELAWPRRLMRQLLAGVGEPYLVVRLGYAEVGADLPAAPRRAAEAVIEVCE